MIPFWKDKALLEGHINKKLREENLLTGEGKITSLAPNVSVQIGTTEGHLCAGYEKLLTLGYRGIITEAESYQSRLDKENNDYQERYNFYEAVKIYYKAAKEFSQRFSVLSLEMAENQSDEKRKKELNNIGAMMDKFTDTVPETFYEAVQFIWFTQNIINITYQRSVVALGRLDQILWSYYVQDIKNGEIDKERALELIEELNLKLTWNVTVLPTDFTLVANALGQNTQTITIAGIDSNGKDATNELSYLFLEAYRNVKVLTTDLSVRIHNKTPREFFENAIEVFKHTSGIAFYNDEIIVHALQNTGYSMEDARNYVIIGCVEPTGQGNNFSATGRMFINLPGVLELTLNNGYSNFSRNTDGLKTGNPGEFITYDQFYDAFTRQLKFNIEKSVMIAEVGDRVVMNYFQHPIVSATLDGCLESGKDYVCGGAKYNYSSITAYGFATLVDSMYNIKKVVYDEKLMTLPDLIDILNSNFENNEVYRQKLINNYDKWGNDSAEIDSLAIELWDLFTQEVSKNKPLRGGRYNAGAYSMGIHVMEGILTRPTADGRKAGRPISNSLSPVNRVEKNGITAIMNSIAKLNYDYAMNGVAVNVRLHPQNLESQENIEKFYYLLKTYFEKGGMQIQPNVVSTETLKDAQIHSENYTDLIVKVGGYNATFVDLGIPIQNDIIDRLENKF